MITRRSASARALVIISTVAVVLVLLLGTAVHAFGDSAPVATVDYQVRAGDSLWSIAAEVADDDADPRSVVAAIRDLNDLTDVMIHPGDVLRVPADR